MSDIKLIGSAEIGGTLTSSDNKFRTWRAKAVESGSLSTIKVYVRGTFKGKVAVYADSSGVPGSLLTQSAEVTLAGTDEWKAVSIPVITIAKDAYYWLAFAVGSSSGVKLGSPPPYSALTKVITYSTFSFPDPAGSGFDAWDYYSGLAGWGSLPGGVGLVGDGLVGNSVLIGGGLVG